MDPPRPSTRRILVTSALPYANGPIHLGHLVEYLQTDIWVRFQKARGRRALYVCADDTHGTAIMIRARQEGRSEESLIADMQRHHTADFAGFDIEFDNYGSTNSPENRELCNDIWKRLRAADLVVERDVVQLYDVKAGTFLADRFVKGTCPVCNLADQYGHGSHVASIVSGDYRLGNAAYEGVSSGVAVYSLKALGSLGTGTSANVIAALDWAIANKASKNIRVINLSLGTPVRDSYKTDPLCLAARRAVNAGIVAMAYMLSQVSFWLLGDSTSMMSTGSGKILLLLGGAHVTARSGARTLSFACICGWTGASVPTRHGIFFARRCAPIR